MSAEAIKQVQDVIGCSEDVAKIALEKYTSVEGAVGALLDGEAFPASNPQEPLFDNSLVLHNPDIRRWDDPPSQSTQVALSGQSGQGWQTPQGDGQANLSSVWDQRGLAPENPIRIPDDAGEDDELQRALAMSLQEQANDSMEAKPPTPVDREQDDIDQAIANSIGQVRGNSTIETAADLSRDVREAGASIALTTQVPALMPFTYMLQALMACESVRSSFQAFRPANVQVQPALPRGTAGTAASPAKRSHAEIEGIRDRRGVVRKPLAATWQLQSLASFCAASKRKQYDVGELLLSVPQPILRKNSSGAAAQDVLRAYYIHVAQSLRDARLLCEDVSSSGGHAHVDRSEAQVNSGSTFHTLTMSSKEYGSGRVTFKQEDLVCAILPSEHAGVTIELALELELRSGRATILQPANVLALALQAPCDAPAGQSEAPLRIKPQLFLDRFLIEQRPEQCASVDALAQDASERQRILQMLQKRRVALSKQKETFTASDLVSASLAFFEGRNAPVGNTWAAERHAEAASRLKAIAEQLEAEIVSLDRRIALEKASITRQWTRIVAEQETLYDAPEWRKTPYELRAACMYDGSGSWLYFKHQGQWWTNREGNLVKAAEEVIFGAEEGSLWYHRPSFLLYDRATDAPGEEELTRIPDLLMHHIEEDNAFLRSSPTSNSPAVATQEGSPSAPLTPDSVMENAEVSQEQA